MERKSRFRDRINKMMNCRQSTECPNSFNYTLFILDSGKDRIRVSTELDR